MLDNNMMCLGKNMNFERAYSKFAWKLIIESVLRGIATSSIPPTRHNFKHTIVSVLGT